MSDCEERAANNFTHQQKKQRVEPGERKPHTFGYSNDKVAHKVFMMLQLLLIKKASEGNIYLRKPEVCC